MTDIKTRRVLNFVPRFRVLSFVADNQPLTLIHFSSESELSYRGQESSSKVQTNIFDSATIAKQESLADTRVCATSMCA